MYDVIIVGAGPTGSYLASKLAEAGDKVLVLERKRDLAAQVCCTGIVSRECINLFNISENTILRWANSAKIFSPSGKLLRLWRGEPQACILDRVYFNQTMAEKAQSSGAKYILNCLVSNIRINDNAVEVQAAQQDERLLFKARAVVIATGFGSNLGERLGLGRVSDFAIGAQAEVEICKLDEIEVYLGRRVTRGFFAWLVPTSENRALVGLLSRHNPELYLEKLISTLILQRKIGSTQGQILLRGVSLKPRARTYATRLIVIGDAAGQVKPITGGGIYYGLLGASIAADTLHQALETDDLSSRNLASYQRRWKRKLGMELKLSLLARSLYEHLSDRQTDRLFDFITSTGIGQTLSRAEDLSFDWHARAILRALKLGGKSIISRPFKITRTC